MADVEPSVTTVRAWDGKAAGTVLPAWKCLLLDSLSSKQMILTFVLRLKRHARVRREPSNPVAHGIRSAAGTSSEFASCLARLDGARSFARAASAKERSRFHNSERRRRLLLRAIACAETAGKALNEDISEICLDLAAQWRDLARTNFFQQAQRQPSSL